MPEKTKENKKNITNEAKLSLEKAFLIFQRQSEILEKAHNELKEKLRNAETSLDEKNRELAGRISEIESISEKLAGILESITDAIFVIMPSGYPEAANSAARMMLKKFGGIKSIFTGDSGINEKIKTKDQVKDEEIILSENGEKKYYLMSIIPMRSGGENSGKKVVCLKDISEQKAMQEKLKREDRMAALGKVAASVAHEIRNPLGAIEGFAMLLERDLKETPKSQKLASKTVYAARQLNSVVSNLLNYTREIRPSLSMKDVNYLIEEALELVRPMADDQKVQIIEKLSPEPLTLMLDPVQIRQVITNLLINAVEACPRNSGGRVEVSSRSDNNYAVLEIKDNGEGIPEKNKKQIFEPFFTMKDGGIGLGLSLCQRMVETHNGEIFECGNPGENAVFVVKLKKQRTDID